VAILVVLAGVISAAGSVSNAASYYWQTSAGDWSVPANWGGTVPGPYDWTYIDNGGTATISLGGMQAYNLYLGDTAGSGAVNMTGGSFSPTQSDYVGYSGAGAFTQSGGTDSASTWYLGYNSACPRMLSKRPPRPPQPPRYNAPSR
jgi:hypothetical protein